MTQGTIKDRIHALIIPILEERGMELVDLEFKREGHDWLLRLFIDQPSGISLDDCVNVSRALGVVLEVEDPIDAPYRLEVSSPGLDRPLTKPQDYDRFAGRKVKIKTAVLLDPDESGRGRKTFIGLLQGLRDNKVALQLADKKALQVEIPLDDIEKANLEIDF
jgi:ribosome maturation factor RimP